MRQLAMRLTLLGGVAGFTFLCLTNWSSASEVKVATTRPNDVFLTSLQRSSSLERAHIKIVVETVAKESDALDAVLKGTAEIGLFAFDALSDRKFDDQPTLFSVFTRPFIFSGPEQIFRVENTPLGDAVLADINRIGVTPLGYWNRGISQILAKQPMTSLEDFRGIIIGGDWSTTYGNNDAVPVLINLGATAKTTNKYIAEFKDGAIGGAVWEPVTAGKSNVQDFESLQFKTYATEFQPSVGMVASSAAYWDSLNTAQKEAWDAAIKQANKLASAAIEMRNSLSSKYSAPVALSHQQILLVSDALPDKERFIKDYNLVNDAEAFLASRQDVLLKKKAN